MSKGAVNTLRVARRDPMGDPVMESGADTVIEDERWEVAGLEDLATQAVSATLTWLKLDAEVVVMGCDDARIAALNADFRGKPRATNVLSWPAVEHLPHAPGAMPELPDTDELGDIAIAYETCLAEAQEAGRPFSHHVSHLIVHGVLHLAGFDHEDDLDAETMQDAERSILQTLSIPDPY